MSDTKAEALATYLYLTDYRKGFMCIDDIMWHNMSFKKMKKIFSEIYLIKYKKL